MASSISSNFFGIRSTYTTTRSGQHFYDEISITELVPDLAAPVLNSVNIAYGKTINLFFDEALDASEATKASNYIINPGNIIPLSANVNGTIVTLHLSDELNTASYTLTAKNARDFKGNTASPQSKSFYYKKPYTAKFNDIVINEIFADPSPQVDLPSVEFIELWNRSEEDIALIGYKYSDLTSTYTFTGDSIKAKEYLILCAKADTLEFKKYGKVIGISPWPSLNNASDYLKLINQNGTLISEVNYNDSWYGDAP